MKKTIASLAILASGSLVLAMPRPPDPNAPKPVLKTICLRVAQTAADGSQSLATCDSAHNNQRSNSQLLANGCAEGQASIRTYSEIAISACMPPGMVQL